MSRTAPLTSKRCSLYIYSTNVGTEYFKHALYSPFFSLQNAVCFIMLTCLVPVLFTFCIQNVLKLKKNNNSSAKVLNIRNSLPVVTLIIAQCRTQGETCELHLGRFNFPLVSFMHSSFLATTNAPILPASEQASASSFYIPPSLLFLNPNNIRRLKR